MKVLVLNGSPRAKGNTSLAVSEIFSAVGLIALAFLPDSSSFFIFSITSFKTSFFLKPIFYANVFL